MHLFTSLLIYASSSHSLEIKNQVSSKEAFALFLVKMRFHVKNHMWSGWRKVWNCLLALPYHPLSPLASLVSFCHCSAESCELSAHNASLLCFFLYFREQSTRWNHKSEGGAFVPVTQMFQLFLFILQNCPHSLWLHSIKAKRLISNYSFLKMLERGLLFISVATVCGEIPQWLHTCWKTGLQISAKVNQVAEVFRIRMLANFSTPLCQFRCLNIQGTVNIEHASAALRKNRGCCSPV